MVMRVAMIDDYSEHHFKYGSDRRHVLLVYCGYFNAMISHGYMPRDDGHLSNSNCER